ncbi:MAG: hypothetical protein RLZZ46_875 [Bacteroidota bacterium]
MSLVSEYPAWIWVIPPFISFLITWWFYRKKGFPEGSAGWAKILMWGGRFFGLTILILLLTEPLIRTSATVYEKPIVAVLADNSRSIMLSANAQKDSLALSNILKQLPSDLADKADVRIFSLGEGLSAWTDSSRFNGKVSDIAYSLDQVSSAFGGLNLAAVLLLSDGLYNRGEDPVNAVRRVKAPVFTVPLGDTIVRNDVILSDVRHNRTAYTGNDFPLQIGIDVNGFAGRKIKLTVTEDNKILASAELTAKTSKQYLSLALSIRAQKKGIHAYKVMAEILEGEFSVENNAKTVYVEVIDSKQKILFLAKGPHPDIAVMRKMLESSEIYETSFTTADEFRGGFDAYSLVVLHRLPESSSRTKPWFNALAASATPRLIFCPENLSTPEFNQIQRVLVYSASRGAPNEVSPLLNKDFSFFNIESSWQEMSAEWSPLNVPYGSWNLTNGSEALFKQKIGSVSTSEPLFALGEPDGIRTGVIAGEGIWKWQMSEFAAHRNHDVFRSLLSKIFQFLTVKKDSRPFYVSSKQLYQQGEDLLFNATLLNPSGEKVSNAEINMNITSEEGKNYPFLFSPSSLGYSLDAGSLPAGKYNWNATVKLGATVYSDKGSFSVSDLNLESTKLTADHALLQTLSASTGGKYIKAESGEISQTLIKSGRLQSVAREQRSVRDLIDEKWLFFIMLFCFSAEWFLRRFSGGY